MVNGKWLLIMAAGMILMGLGLMSPLAMEGRAQALWQHLSGPEWAQRPARIVHVDCVRESPDRDCARDGRFEVRYRYQYEGESYESERLGPQWLLADFDEHWYRSRQEMLSEAALHSRPLNVYVNTENPEEAEIFRPDGVGRMATASALGLFLIVAGVFVIFRGWRRLYENP